LLKYFPAYFANGLPFVIILLKSISMKKGGLVIQILLVIAVGVLYFLHFQQGNQNDGIKAKPKAKITTQDSLHGGIQIAYIDLDTLNEKIDYIRNMRKSLESEQQAVETEWENAYKELEAEKNKFLNRGKAITQEEAESFQSMLIQKQQMVDGRKQQKLQKLNEKSFKFLEDVQLKLKSFLNEYNEGGQYSYILSTGNGLDYLIYKDSASNISDDVVAGMNELLKKEKK
jgi:outer membrane protein